MPDIVLPYALALIVGAALTVLGMLAWRYFKPQRSSSTPRQHIFIYYQLNTSPDQELARSLYDALKGTHNVIIFNKFEQREQIRQTLQAARWFIPLLSSRSLKSSDFTSTVADARQHAAHVQIGLIPVRIRQHGSLNGRLDDLPALFWDGPEDTPQLLADLKIWIGAGRAPVALSPQPAAEPSAPYRYPPSEPDAAGKARERLIRERDDLGDLLDTQFEKLRRIRHSRVSESDPARVFQLEQQIKQEERQIAELEDKLVQIERELRPKAAPHEPGHVGALPPEVLAKSPEGTMASDSPLYITRSADREVNGRLRQSDVTIVIRGPRQVGKSSLLRRMLREAEDAHKRVVFIDFQSFDKADLESPDQIDHFFQQFFMMLTHDLGLDQRVGEYWAGPGGNRWRGTRYMDEYVLARSEWPIVLAMDEVDRLPKPFRNEFFGMLRSWHNARAETASLFRRLDLIMIISSDPDLLIDREHESPFNVAHKIWLRDFTLDEVKELNYRYGRLLAEETSLKRLYRLLNGHPYLVRKAFHSVYCNNVNTDNLFKHAGSEQGIFWDHLQWMRGRLRDVPQLSAALIEVIDSNTCGDTDLLIRLRSAGLVREEGGKVLPRCELYARYFKTYLSP